MPTVRLYGRSCESLLQSAVVNVEFLCDPCDCVRIRIALVEFYRLLELCDVFGSLRHIEDSDGDGDGDSED